MRESMTPDVRARWAALLPSTEQMTVDELVALPEHRWRYELIAGQLTPRPAGDLRYDLILRLLGSVLRDHVRAADIEGVVMQETGVVVSADGAPHTVLVPALAVIHSGHESRASVGEHLSEMPALHLMPTLVVEIAAPGQEQLALADRARTWLGAGVQVVWVIWPARRQVDVWRAGPASDVGHDSTHHAVTPVVTTRRVHEVLDAQDILPGFAYPIAHLIA